MRPALVRAAVMAALAGTFLVGGAAAAKVPPAASPPVWSHPRFSVHWENAQFLVDEQSGLLYALVDLVDDAGNVVGTNKDTYHADFEEWEYTFFWPGTTEVAGTFRIPMATSDPHASSNRGSPGPAAELYHFRGMITEATGVFAADGAMPMVGGTADMRAEVGRDGAFGCTCTITKPACGPCKVD